MALRELPSIGTLSRLVSRPSRPTVARYCGQNRRQYAAAAAEAPKQELEDLQDLESQSSLSPDGPLSEKVAEYDPVKTAQRRKGRLPASRYG